MAAILFVHQPNEKDIHTKPNIEESPVSADSPPLNEKKQRTNPRSTLSESNSTVVSSQDIADGVEDEPSQYPSTVENRLAPIVPTNFQRYSRNVTIPKGTFERTIRPGRQRYPDPTLPNEWSSIEHPEGVRYFFNTALRVYTDANVSSPEIYEQVEKYLNIIQPFLSDYREIELRQQSRRESVDSIDSSSSTVNLIASTIPEFDLVLDIAEYEGIPWCGYYLVDHAARSVFWLDPFDCEESLPRWDEIKGEMTSIQLKYEMEVQYWHHCSLFPDSCPMNDALKAELKDNLVHRIADLTLNDYLSTVPQKIEHLQMMLNLMEHFQNDLGSKDMLARFMGKIAHHKVYNFHSTPHARLSRNQSVYQLGAPKRSLLIRLISPIFFYAPDVNLKVFQEIYVDELVSINHWKEAMAKRLTEWQEFTLFATVMLSVNMGYLAIPMIASNGYTSIYGQIASYVSTAQSSGALIIGMSLMRKGRSSGHETAGDVSVFLRSQNHPWFGLEPLAIIYSLPYSFLIWSVVTLLIALQFMYFETTEIANIIFVSVISAAILTFIACTLMLSERRFWKPWGSAVLWKALWHKLPTPSSPNKVKLGKSRKGSDTVV